MLKMLVCCGISLFSLQIFAADITQISRYATVENKPLPAQINPLKSIQQTHFPISILTIGDAIHQWLAYSGYHLAPADKQSPDLKQILKQPLPQVDRNLGPLSVEDGLSVLIGQHLFSLKHNDLQREVNFTLIRRKA